MLGETQNALHMAEGSYGPVVYVPRADMASMEHPILSLSTAPERRVLNYDRNGVRLEINFVPGKGEFDTDEKAVNPVYPRSQP